MTKRKILFYAPLGKDTPPEMIGGAEAGCLKTLDCYRKNGFEVIVIHKPTKNNGIFRYMQDMFIVPILVIKHLLKNKTSVLHIAGFYLKLVYFEFFLLLLARILRHKVIYEIRNGGMIEAFNEGSSLYKRCMRRLIVNSTLVLCQGKEYEHFINENWSNNTSYYPNYIRNGYLSTSSRTRSNNKPINLSYFGRITESKNVDLIIKTFKEVNAVYPNSVLNLIGGYSASYKIVLDSLINEIGILPQNVNFHGRQDFDYIHRQLLEAHYFVFPSQEKREGHSNSLTEAMGIGVVPLVSNIGFNASICGNRSLVVDSFNPSDYADRIVSIEKNGEWEMLSERVRKRIEENFTEDIVSKHLIERVSHLF